MKNITYIIYLLLMSVFLSACSPLSSLHAYRKRVPVIDVYCYGKFIKQTVLIVDTPSRFGTLVGWKLDTVYDKSICRFKKIGGYYILYIYSNTDPSPEFTIQDSDKVLI